MIKLILAVQNFKPTIVYITGKFNSLADLMSRLNREDWHKIESTVVNIVALVESPLEIGQTTN